MKNAFSFRWFLRPEGMIMLLAAFWSLVYIMNTAAGYDYFGIWPEPTVYWPLMLLVFSAIYVSIRDFRQWRLLQYYHVASLILFPVLMFHWAASVGNIPEETYYLTNNAGGQERNAYRAIVDVLVLPAAIFVLVAQVAFVINIIAGFIRGKKLMHE